MNSAVCQRCMMEEENFLCSVRYCTYSKRIWQLFGFVKSQLVLEMDQYDWVHEGVTGEREALFIASLWWAL